MPKAQQDYRVQLNMVGGGYCKQTNVEAGFRVYIWIKETGLANLGRVVSVGELPSGHECGRRGESYVGHFLHTLSTTTHGPEEGSAIPA